MKKLFAYVLSGVLAASAVVATPVAASAAPSKFALPKACAAKSITTKEMKQDRDHGWDAYDLKRADVHPAKGKEWVFTTTCNAGDWGADDVLVIANSKGKVLKSKIFKGGVVDVKSASKKSGVKLLVNEIRTTKGDVIGVGYWRDATYKWNTKSKKFTYKKASVPSWVKNVGKAVEQAHDGKKLTGLTGSTSMVKKFRSHTQKLTDTVGLFVDCEPYATKRTNCVVIGNVPAPALEVFEFSFKKSGSKHKISKVGKLIQDPEYFLG